MKILLAACNAKYIHSNLAVYNLRAYAKEYEEHILLREYTINQQKDEILRDIYKEKPEVICFSCYIWNISFVRDIMTELKKILPETVLWTGGPEVSFHGEAFLRENPFVTGVMVGEGEKTFYELARYYCQGEPAGGLKGIRGLCWQEQGEIYTTAPRELMNLSEIPFVYEKLQDFENRIIYYESSRGCPFSCSYCLSSVDKKLRFRNLELVKRELQFFLDHQVPQVKFVDRTFNCNHKHAMTIWQYLLEHDNGKTNFHFEIGADLLTEEELQLMSRMRPGLIQLEIGVQSTNPRTLEAIRRKMDFQKVARVVKRVREMENIHQHLDLIAGLPYEDLDSFRHSFNEVYELRPQQLQLGFLKVLKGAYMEEMAPSYGCVYQSREPYEVLQTNWLSYGDLLVLKTVESMVEVYYNSGQFHHTLLFVEPYFDSACSFYEQLGNFYERKGYGAVSHSRLRRYEILLEFLEENGTVPMEQVKERMVFDLYWREKLKNRPGWASDQKPYEQAVWEYRRRNKIPKTAHIEVFAQGKAVLFDYERRSPFHKNASTYVIDLQLEE